VIVPLNKIGAASPPVLSSAEMRDYPAGGARTAASADHATVSDEQMFGAE
jgi:hypothetical protein